MRAIVNIPLVKKELRQSLRGPAALAMENAYLLGIAATGLFAVLAGGFGSVPTWQTGERVFWLVMMIQSVFAVVLGASVAAPAMAAESEQKTLDILAATPLSPHQIVWSKLVAAALVAAGVLATSLPMAASLFALGGVSPGLAVWSWILVCGAAAVGAALGLYCSVMVGRTAAAVSLAVIVGLGAVFAFNALVDSSPALAAVSPLGSVTRLGEGPRVPLFGALVPVWVVPVVLWGGAMLVLGGSAAQRLTPPALRRLWSVRWQFAAFSFLLALVAMGSLAALGSEEVWCVGST